MKAREATTYWVCTDCYFEANGVLEDDSNLDVPRSQLLSLIPEDGEVTSGLVFEEHQCGQNAKAWREWRECDCERIDFSSQPCEGCGSYAAGAREALTVWTN